MPDTIKRTLWYETRDGRVWLTQADLRMRNEPLIILGEAGMGKSHLLEWLGASPEYSICTARQLINRPNPRTLLGDAQILVIDALDEVSAQNEGDAVNLVLHQLGVLDFPRFVLSCRVSDWRSATGLEAIREQYPQAPLQLHLEPFDDNDTICFLNATVGEDTAKAVVQHFSARGLGGLLGNPQTLELISRVAGKGDWPATRGDLFEQAIEVLRVEHRDAKADQQPARRSALDSAGAAFSALIITGNEALVRKAAANSSEGELQLADVGRLPGGEAVEAMLGTRLFKSDGADRFTYWHRRIGEYLGAQWLAQLADTNHKRRRLLSLFHSYELVPANLRGIHSWLALDPHLAPAVIAADPMGVIEYGDADNLTVEQARLLLRSLEKLAAYNPRFRDWGPYSVRGIAQPDLIEDVRRLITTPETPFGLRLLVLQAIKGSKIAHGFSDELRKIVVDPQAIFADRSAAGDALIELAGDEDWGTVLHTLHSLHDDSSVRLAIELTDYLGYEPFTDDLIVDLVLAHLENDDHTVGVLMRLERNLPESRLDGILDRIAELSNGLGRGTGPRGNHGLTDFVYHLLVRRVAAGAVDAKRLWSWLEPFDASVGYRRETRQQLDTLIQNDDPLRLSIQRFVLIEQPSVQNISQRSWRLRKRSSALAPTPSDLASLLRTLNPADRADERWRDLVQLVQHNGDVGVDVRLAARPFAAHRPDLLDWLDRLAEPRVPEWQVRQAEHERRQRAKQSTTQAEHRKNFAAHINKMRVGDYGSLINPAKAYLHLFSDIGDGVPAHERVPLWLGPDIGAAAHMGFEAYLLLADAKPSAKEISEAFAKDQHWNAVYIIVAGLAERFRKGVGFDDLPDDRLMAGLFELRHTQIDDHAGIQGLQEALEAAVQRRGIWREAMHLYYEPQLQARREHVPGLYALAQDTDNAEQCAELAAEWLLRFPNLSANSETELIDLLIRSGRYEDLRRAAESRAGSTNAEQIRNWDAVGLIVDFDSAMARLEALPIEPELLWHMRHRTSGRFGDDVNVKLGPAQLEWIITTFRPLWPMVSHPKGVTSGDTNSWDACDYLIRLIRLLANDPGESAVVALKRLRSAPADGYTEIIQVVSAEQARIRVEAAYSPPSLEEIDAIASNTPPESAADLQALMLEELDVVQAKIKSDDVDSWRGFYDDAVVPFEEERCRDHLLGLLRQGTGIVTLEPEVHLAADKEVDIACSVGALRMPIEVKGQWHRDLWHGADTQLDRLYTGDWRADGRGIYLVLWFGHQKNSNKSLANPGRGKFTPQTPHQLQEMLAASSKAACDKRVAIVVLDLTRP